MEKEYRITKPIDCKTRDFERALAFLQTHYKDLEILTAQPHKQVLKLGV